MPDNIYPTDFYAEFDESSPEWNIADVAKELSLRPKFLDVYAGVTEYDPDGETSISVQAGELIHEKGSKYICRALSTQTITPPEHLPVETNQQFQVYTIISYINAYVQEHADALIYKGAISSTSQLPLNKTNNSYEKGWTYKASQSFEEGGIKYDAGDMFICNTDRKKGETKYLSDWDVIQTNIDTVDGKFTNSLSIGRKANTNIGQYSVAEGFNTEATSDSTHAEGHYTKATGEAAHSEGNGTTANANASHAEGEFTEVSGEASHAEGHATSASGDYSHAEGKDGVASELASHAEGNGSIASNISAHAEGFATTASGANSHSEGRSTHATDDDAHAEGFNTFATGAESHAEGSSTVASGLYSHAEGQSTNAVNASDHAEGDNTVARGNSSHAEGSYTNAVGGASHAEGYGTYAAGHMSHAQGNGTVTDTHDGTTLGRYNLPGSCINMPNWQANKKYVEGQCVKYNNKYWLCISGHQAGASFNANLYWLEIPDDTTEYVEIVGGGESLSQRANIRTLDFDGNETISGNETINGGIIIDDYISMGRDANETIGQKSVAEGLDVKASGNYSHAEGNGTSAAGAQSHSEGYKTQAGGDSSHAEGYLTTSSGNCSHSEGQQSVAKGNSSHAEGSNTFANGFEAHAEGNNTIAYGDTSHAQGYSVVAYEEKTFSFGRYNLPGNTSSIPEWIANTDYKVGQFVRRNNKVYCCITTHTGQSTFVQAAWKEYPVNTTGYAETVGNGTSSSNRSNARTLDWNGNEVLAGKLTLGSGPTNNMDAATKQYVDEHIDVVDAFQYKGTITAYNQLPSNAKKGWTYKVSQAFGAYDTGDMFIRNTDNAGTETSKWDVIQNNIDGAVTGPASSTDSHPALFDGTTGKVIRDGGTIQSLIIDNTSTGSDKVWSASKSKEYTDLVDALLRKNITVWNGQTSYHTGQYVWYNDNGTWKLYRFKAEAIAYGSLNPNTVDLVSRDLMQLIQLIEASIAQEFDDRAYMAGDCVMYMGKLYKYNVSHTAGSGWKSTQVSAITLMSLINENVVGPNSSTADHVALFNGTTGKKIKDGGTIQSLLIDDTVGDGNTNKVWSADKVTDELAKKTDKVASATNNNFAALDANGNLKDSGHKHSDYLTSYDPILIKNTFNIDATNSTPIQAFSGSFPTYIPVNKDYAHCYVADYYLSNPNVFTEDIKVSYTSSTDTLDIFVGLKPNSPASTITITLCKQEAATTTMYLNTGYQYTDTPNIASASRVQAIIDDYAG